MPRMHVNAAALNIRATPGMTADNIVATLPFGHPVETRGEHDLQRWIAVEAELDGKTVKGFVNVGYLRAPLADAKEALLATAATAWHAKGKALALSSRSAGYAGASVKTGKPAICDIIESGGPHLVVARGLTQVWALGPDMRIGKFPLLEDGRLDDPKGRVTALQVFAG